MTNLRLTGSLPQTILNEEVNDGKPFESMNQTDTLVLDQEPKTIDSND